MQAVITGYGCRLPGAASPKKMWQVLENKGCTVGTILPDRFPIAAHYDPSGIVRGKTYSTAAGQLPHLFDFDPESFGISRREAPHIDPQQRLLLEVVRDAMEDGQHPPHTLAGPRTGVYVACSSFDHMGSFFADMARSDQAFMYGNAMSIVANRISRQFDLRGPSLTVDTACSSGLTALNLALSAIETGEIDTAIVGGANTLISPGSFVGFAQASMLSPTGRCHAFDAQADGYVRSDAIVAFIIRRADLAHRDGDRIRARILACGINTDGAQGTAMAPSELSQIALMQRVRDLAGRAPSEVAFVEAHGTGTPIGDPVEAASIGAVWSDGRDAPLPMGSSKSNFGHSEPVAGLVGLLKAVLALEKGAVPPSVFKTPNPNIDFAGLGLQLQETLAPITGPLAVVNSFGFGGTNGCVVLERAAPDRAQPAAKTALPFLPLSAPTQDALQALSALWADQLMGATPTQAKELAAQVWHGRDHGIRRLAVPLDDLTEGRSLLLRAAQTDSASMPAAVTDGPGVALVFPGNGAQITEMGVPFYEADPTWRAAFDTIATAFTKADGPDLIAALGNPDLTDLGVAQGLLFATQVATAQRLIHSGAKVAATIGHSVGEIAAAHVAGILTLDQAAQIITLRSTRLQSLAGQGGMAVVSASAQDAGPYLVGGVVVAAQNGPRSTTISGPVDDLTTSLDQLRAARIASVRLSVAIPYHSPALDPLRPQMEADFATLKGSTGNLPFFGGADGGMVAGADFNGPYLWRNARDPVRFDDATKAAVTSGIRHFLELAPRPTLAGPIRAVLDEEAVAFRVLSSADIETQPNATCDALIARLWEAGVQPFTDTAAGTRHVHAALPLTPFVRDYFRAPITQTAADPWSILGHLPILGRRINSDGTVWDGDIAAGNPAWLADHAVNGQPVVPATMLFQIALRAAAPAGAALELIDFALRGPLAPAEGGTSVRTKFDAETGVLVVEARPRLTPSPWVRIADGTVIATAPATGPDRTTPDGADISPETLYLGLEKQGLQYGPAFRLVQALRIAPATLSYTCDLAPTGAALDGYAFNPFALDAALHGFGALLAKIAPDEGLHIPTAVRRLRVFSDTSDPRHAEIRVTARHARTFELNVTLFDANGHACLLAEGMELTAVARNAARTTVRLWHKATVSSPLPGSAPAFDLPMAEAAATSADGLSGWAWVHRVLETLAMRHARPQDLSVVIMAVPLPSDIRKLRDLGFCNLTFTLFDAGRLAAARRSLPADLRGWLVPVEALAARQFDVALMPEGVTTDDALPLQVRGYLFRPGTAPVPATRPTAPTRNFRVLPVDDTLAATLDAKADQRGADLVIVLRHSLETTALAIAAAMQIVQKELLYEPASITLVTIGCTSVFNGAIAAFTRTLRNEYPALTPRLIITSSQDVTLTAALCTPSSSIITDLRADCAITTALIPAEVPAGNGTFRLGTGAGQRTGIASLAWQPIPCPKPGPDEVLIRVRAIGLNYRDAMIAQGLLSGKAVSEGRFGRTCGFECSGEVMESNVTGIAPGARVMALAPDAAATHMMAPADAVFPIPDGISFDQAAGLAVTYATARIALVETARIVAGEKVLIHGAAGGVGIAAMRIARSFGARIFATAGTDAKRTLCLAEGAEWVGDSRSLAFGAELRAVTGGEGVDVVINSLAGAAAQQSLELLAPFGRFIELGKRGFVEGARLRTAALRLNQSWSAVDLDHMMKHVPNRVRAAMETVRIGLENGTLTPLPVQVVAPEDALTAFDTLLHARHVGKVVLTPPGPSLPVPARIATTFETQGSWLITGGTGAIGLRLGRWLRASGAQKVWLVSRDATPARDERDDILDWIDSDKNVALRSCDVADETALTALLAEIARDGPLLEGVIHGAGALRDTSIRDLDSGDMAAVLRPKVTGAQMLDQLTRDDPPKHMLFLSSVSVPLGTMGQASYVAANGAMEAVAEARAAAGLPARILALGPVAGRGMAVRSGLLSAGAIDLIAPDDLGRLAATALTGSAVWTLAARMDWNKLANGFATLAEAAYDRVLIREPASHRGAHDLLIRLKGLPPSKARREIEKALANVLSGVLRTEPAQIDPLRPLTDLGVDSLLALEIKLEVESMIGQPMPEFGLGEVVTPRLLAQKIQEALDRTPDNTKES